jgi:hypothetical protein
MMAGAFVCCNGLLGGAPEQRTSLGEQLSLKRTNYSALRG